MDITVASQGFGISFGLIVAIGAQNSYVIKKGILKENVFAVALTCFLIDVTLVTLGTLGLGSIIGSNRLFLILSTVFGVLFLTYYGISSILRAIKNSEALTIEEGNDSSTLKKTLLTLLALSLLNPHVYLDTVILIGSVGSKYAAYQKLDFLIGTYSASFIWFFGLAYGARILIPIFKKEITWKILDVFIGITMLTIAYGLVQYALKSLL